MGFMDKAKKLAEQAQQKLDEAQTQFNQNASPESAPGQNAAQYDEHGRPMQQDEEPPRRPPTGDANATPDPFKPLQ